MRIREAEPSDEAALRALEYAAPDTGPWRVRVEPRIPYWELVGRYPNARGFVAVVPDPVGGERVVGMLFSSVAPTRLAGALIQGAYLYGLRVHPGARRRGIATSLIRDAWQQARDAGAELAWAIVVGGNHASLAAFARAGIPWLRDACARIVLPVPRFTGRSPGFTVRRATTDDISWLVDALNRAHSSHDLWRPLSPAELSRQLTAAHHSVADVRLVLDATSNILAAGAGFHVARVARVELLGHRVVPTRLNRALAAIAARLSGGNSRAILLRHRLHLATEARAGEILIRAMQWSTACHHSALAVPMDPRDPYWPSLARLPGFTTRLHVVASSALGFDGARPLHLI